MKKIAIVLTDTHLKEKNIETNKSIYLQSIILAKNNKLNYVFHAGDIFDSRKAQPIVLLKAFEEILTMFEDNKITLVAIPGNHDKTDYTSEDSFLNFFRYHPNFKLVSKFEKFSLNENVDLTLIPFFDEKETYSSYLKKSLNEVNKNKYNILLTHISINGVRNNDGSEVKSGIDKSLLTNYNNVLVGHYHDSSNVGNNVKYIGSAFQHNFGEDENKGFTLIDSEGETSFFKSEFPEYKKIIINVEDFNSLNKKELINSLSNDTNENIRIVFKGTYEELQSIKIKEYLDLGIDVKLSPNEISSGIIEASNDEVISFDKKSLISEFEIYCEKNQIKNKEQGINYLKKSLLWVKEKQH